MFKRVLIADDSPVNQKIIGYLVESFHYAFDVASTGLEAIKALSERDYALVLMDLRMPDMDGFTAARAIRESGSTVPIIGISAFPMQEDHDMAMAAGMNEFMPKPVNTTVFESALKRWVASTMPQ